MKDCFIFDFDGTLMDSMYIWDTVDYEFLVSKGIPKEELPENLSEIFKPKSLWEAAEYFISEFGLAMQPAQVCEEINAMVEYKYRFDVCPKPGVVKFLEKNKAKKMCIATASDTHLVQYVLDRTGLNDYFSFIITSTEVGNSKREPDIFLQAAERLGASPKDCIVFEDSPHALETAKKAGFYTVAIKDKSYQKEEAYIRSLADQFVVDLNETIFENLE